MPPLLFKITYFIVKLELQRAEVVERVEGLFDYTKLISISEELYLLLHFILVSPH